VTGQWFSPSTAVSSTNKTDCHDITEILLKVALNTITITPLTFSCKYNPHPFLLFSSILGKLLLLIKPVLPLNSNPRYSNLYKKKPTARYFPLKSILGRSLMSDISGKYVKESIASALHKNDKLIL
jgi:hypothetical protein